MKKITLIVAILALLTGGCTKNYYGSDQTYHVDGITNINVSPDQRSRSIYLQVTYLGSDQESIDLSLENVPAGLYTRITNPSGYPSFSTQVYFYDSSAAEGVYTVNLVATGKKSGRRVLPFKVTVDPVATCSSTLTGPWSTSNACTVGVNFTENVSEVPGVVNRIRLTNFENMGTTVYADLSCLSRTLTMPSQTVNGVTYSGSGYFYTGGGSSYIRLSYSRMTSGGSITNCQEYLSR